MFFDFRGQKVQLKAEFEGTPGLLAEAGSIFWIRVLAARSLSTYGSDTGSDWQNYYPFSEHLSFYGSHWKYFIFTCAFCLTAPNIVLYSGDIVSTYILIGERNALLFLAFTRVSYSMPSGENKENKAYSRWIFFNLRPNEIARIIEHLQKGTFVPTRGANVYKQHNLSNSLQKEVPMISETCLKIATNDVLWLSGPKSPA